MAGLAATLAQRPLIVAGTNAVEDRGVIARSKGNDSICQEGEVLPRGTTAVRLWIAANIKPSVSVAAFSGSRLVTMGSEEGSWLGKVGTVPVAPVPRRIAGAQLCFSIGPAVEDVYLFGGPAPNPLQGEARGKVRIEYLRPGPRSWWSLAHSVAQRIGFGRWPAGAWVALLPLALMGMATALASWTILRQPRGGRRVPAVAWTCAGVAFLSAASWSIVTPPFEVTDEPSHFSYTQILAETQRLPTSNTAPFSQEELAALRDLDAYGVRFNPAIGTISSPSQQRFLESDLKLPRSRSAQGAGVARPQPPLYYALQTIPYGIASGGNLLERLELMRLLSALMAGFTGIFAFLFLREALPRVPWAWTVGALGVALFPLVGFISGAVNPDAMLCAVSAALFYCLARAFRRGLSARMAIAIGVVTAIGFLTKLNFIGLAPGILLALVVLTRRAARSRGRRAAYRSLGLALAIGVSPGCVYVIVNLASGHAALGLLSTGISGTSKHHGSLPQEIVYIWESYLPRLPGMANYFPGLSSTRLWFNRSVGLYGWLDTTFPNWVYSAAVVPAVAIVALCASGLIASRAALRRRGWELATYAVMSVGLLALVGADSYLEFPGRSGGYSEPRYLLPLAVLFAAAFTLAARGAGRRWGPVARRAAGRIDPRARHLQPAARRRSLLLLIPRYRPPRAPARRGPPAAPAKERGGLLAAVGEVLGVDLRELLPLVGQLVLGEAGVHRAGLHAGVAVDALLRIDVEHLGRVVAGLVGRRVDAIHGAHLDTGVVLGADARLSDHVGHSLSRLGCLQRVSLGGAYCTEDAAAYRRHRPGGLRAPRPPARRRRPGALSCA